MLFTSRLAIALALYFAFARLFAFAAEAPTTNYTSVEATADLPVQLSYHASAHKANCEPAPAPEVRVLQPPKMGSLIVRKATLGTDKVPGCPRMNIPAKVVFYNAKEGYLGEDKVKYEVTSSGGEVADYEVTITVKPSTGKPSKPGAADGTKL